MVKKETIYETRDLGLSAVFLLHDIPTKDIRVDGNTAYIVFELSSNITALAKNYLNRRLKLEPLAFQDAIRSLRSAVRTAIDSARGGYR